jgi:mannose-1-phosphate guanylyltransferase / mannose-6-phosphate isomerase
MIIVILAGGRGTRLWPLSHQGLPKQFLRIKDHRSLLQKTFLRFVDAPAVEKILIVTNEKHREIVETHLKEIDAACHIISEPTGKNTAPAISLALKYIEENIGVSKKTKVLISPSDHLIVPEKKFKEDLSILQKADFEDHIITFGIKPTRPETGYGYIKIKKRSKEALFSSVESFIEKPSFEKAEKFLLDGNYLWNAGLFLFSIDTFWEEMKEHSEDLYNAFQSSFESLLKNFHNLPNISIDYALMEKTKKIKLFPLDVTWSDIGSWDSVYDVLDKDKNFNVKHGKVYDLDTKNSLILANKRKISTIGLEDIIIVETDEGIFIGKKGHSQKIKELAALENDLFYTDCN